METSKSRPWMLGELTYHDLKDDLPEVAVLPFGAVEPHNLHLPYATDVIEAELIGSAICEKAMRQGAKVVCLPPIPYGTQTTQQMFPLAMNLQPSTLLTILGDLLESLENTGLRKCLILNSHGGNDFKGHMRELFGRTSVHLFLCNWYTVCNDVYQDLFEHPDNHAGEMETSLILHARPELVQLANADDGQVRSSRFEAVRQGWIQLTRPWDRLTTNTGAGNPKQASAEKGEKFLEIVTTRIASFLVELSAAPIDDSFPFEEE